MIKERKVFCYRFIYGWLAIYTHLKTIIKPGKHELTFDSAAAPLSNLTAGKYELVIEAAREVGGRELVRLPFQWPPQKPVSAKASGEHELGEVTLTLTP